MAKLIAGVATSHVPAIGAALDNGKTGEPYWQRVFRRLRVLEEVDRRAEARRRVILVYNDHASAFSLEIIPTFALGCAEEFPPADEGWGAAAGAGGARVIPISPGTSRNRPSSMSST